MNELTENKLERQVFVREEKKQGMRPGCKDSLISQPTTTLIKIHSIILLNEGRKGHSASTIDAVNVSI